jgi:serine/threonine-protein kinase HipA
MNHKQRLRQPGEPLSSELVKTIRLRNGLSQDEFAARLGLRGGKSVISGWETGRTRCEGPAAELILRLFGESQSDTEPLLLSEADKEWKRAGNNFLSSWRQIAIIPFAGQSIEREAFIHLFPGVEIPPDQYAHGFPFVDHKLPRDVYRLDERGWIGAVPVERSRPPEFLWRLTREGAFVYREHRWEDQSLSVTEGHIHFGSQFNIAMAAVFFYRRLIEHLHFAPERKLTLRLDLEGIEGKGVVAYQAGRALNDFTLDEPTGLSPKNHASFMVEETCQEIVEKPLQVGQALVGEFALALRPDLASKKALEEQLRKRYLQDDEGDNTRFLGFLDESLRLRLARVSMAGVPVGILSETPTGSLFSYDPAYLRRNDALPLSPTLPLELKTFRARGLHPFFANLLPEGTRLAWICQRRGLDPRDEFGVLLATGRDAIGAVEIHAETEARR